MIYLAGDCISTRNGIVACETAEDRLRWRPASREDQLTQLYQEDRDDCELGLSQTCSGQSPSGYMLPPYGFINAAQDTSPPLQDQGRNAHHNLTQPLLLPPKP